MATYYPSCVVNFTLLFDETLHVTATPPPEAGTVDKQVEGAVVPQPPYTEPLILQPGLEGASKIFNRVPKRCTVELPGYRQAGTFTIEMDFLQFPINPQVARAWSAEIHIGAVSAVEFAQGMAVPNPNALDGSTRSILRTRNELGLPNPDTLVMVGLVDEAEVTHNDKGSSISLKGRDLRGALLDMQVASAPVKVGEFWDQLDTTQPIDVVVANILALYPGNAFQNCKVLVNPDEWPDAQVPSPAAPGLRHVSRHRQGAKGTRAAPRMTMKSETGSLSFWDLIVQFCYLVGAIPFFRGYDLLIRPSRAIFAQQRAGFDGTKTPFKGGAPRAFDQQALEPIDPPLSVRRLVYGRDLQSLSFDRKYTGFQRPRVVRLVAVDPDGADKDDGLGQLIVAEWPPDAAVSDKAKAARKTFVGPGARSSSEQVLILPAPSGVTDPERLTQIAHAIYEEIGRGEVGGSASTPNLASFGGNNADPDLVRLRPGDGVEFLIDTRNLTAASPLVSALIDSERNSFEEQVRRITRTLGDENLARVLVASTRGNVVELQRFFRVANVRYDWGERGLRIDFDYQNYVIARSQVDDVSTTPGEVKTRPVPRREAL
jgi:hypothetical protein